MTRGDIIDAIDFLVDDQVAGYNDRSGYDHNVNQDRCWNCDGEWHGLAITERMRRMRWFGQVDPDYRYADDDSRIYCPGSDVAGPVRNERELPRWTITVGDQGTSHPADVGEQSCPHPPQQVRADQESEMTMPRGPKPGEPGYSIPHEEMRRILGLPDTRKLLERDRLDALFSKAIRKERHFREQPPGTCLDCGAHIEDWWTHHRFHEAIVDAFKGRDRNIQKIVEHLRRTP